MRTAALALLAATLLVPPVAADFMAYHGVVDLQADGDTFTVRHHHDYSKKDLVSFVSWQARGATKVLLRQPSPALTWLGVSPDSRFVIGLSWIKFANDHQVAIWDRDGKLLVREAVAGRGLPFVMESKSNFVHWFDPRDPSPTVVLEGDEPVALRFKARTGVMTELRFQP